MPIMPAESKKSKRKVIQSLHHVPSLKETIARMSADGRLSKEREDYINSHLEEWVADSKYILIHLGVHIGMGFVRFTAMPFPLPIGSTLRPLWVMAMRMYCNLTWNMRRKRVHSIPVLLFAIIPFLGYFAYTIPLRKKSEYLTYLYAQHISYSLYDKTLEQKLSKVPNFIKKIAYALLVPGEIRHRKI
jgi:hypothetical protein